ncbi:hypothetical protein BOTCAL_0052g00370 [Botryotinia calthae]|uniref:Uncharacterized protein n=1 Tax=Botryotinia calthae TaxID=38488 RepID=A0A4Y8DAT9_9HELO|nr:hypothetical protein BOTCAL_0052g00370 [Botryotinia calthae]
MEHIEFLDNTIKEYKEYDNDLEDTIKENFMEIVKLKAQIPKVAAKPKCTRRHYLKAVRDETALLKNLMRTGIRSQIKWANPTDSQFYQTGLQDFRKMLVLDLHGFICRCLLYSFYMDTETELGVKKQWRQKRIRRHNFEAIVVFELTFWEDESIEIRYCYFALVGKDVMVRWDAVENEFTVSGKHGIPRIG